tara:strand:- start:786 stop:1427 length:642 start_codon:yes stop_codon:yes gene_type:complete
LTNFCSIGEFKKLLPPGVNLLAVSKGHPSSSIRRFVNQGQLQFGESRFQEALPKINELNDLQDIRWHFIGRLQANKVKGVVKNFDVIQSVDSVSLAERISRISVEESRTLQVMLQVKFRDDPNKTGFTKENILSSWSKLNDLKNIKIIGLMTITPLGLDLEARKSVFRDCRAFANSMGLKDCSMGMSLDWKEAIDAGSTWIRVGSLLFGQRPQ